MVLSKEKMEELTILLDRNVNNKQQWYRLLDWYKNKVEEVNKRWKN